MHARVKQIDFHASFQTGIGGSSAAAVCGLSRHRTAHEVLLSIKGAKRPDEQSDAMWLGKEIEPVIRAFYKRKTGIEIYAPGDSRLYVHPKHEWMVCHPDGFEVDESGDLLEVKFPGRHNFHEWGEVEYTQVPQEHLCQCYHNMMVCGVPRCKLVVMLCNELRIYPVQLDKEIAASIFVKEQEFWTRHVIGNEPLPADGSEGCREYLTWLHPHHKEPMDWASGEAARDINELARQLEDFDAAKANCEELKNKIRAHIGDKEGLRTDKLIVTWRADVNGKKSLRTKSVKELEGVA